MPQTSTALCLAGAMAVSLMLTSGPAMAQTPASATAATTASRAVPDPLDNPARRTPKALSAVLMDVSRAGPRLVAVGERGAILLSDDSGASWRQAGQVPVSVALTSVHFANERQGIAVGHSGVVLATADGGENWVVRLTGRQIIELARAEAEELARLQPGSPLAERIATEARRLEADGPDKPLLAVRMLDHRHGWALGAYGLVLMTEDGGESWSSVMGRLPNSGGNHLYAIARTALGLTIAGEMGAVFSSSDGGQSFKQIETPYEGSFFGILPMADGQALAFGLRGNAWIGRDGAEWRKIELDQAATLIGGLILTDGSALLADETGRLYRGNADGSGFRLVGQSDSSGLSALTLAPDSGLVATGLRGARRIDAGVRTAQTAHSSTDRNP